MNTEKLIKRLKRLRKKCIEKRDAEVEGCPEYNFQYGRAEGLDRAIKEINNA